MVDEGSQLCRARAEHKPAIKDLARVNQLAAWMPEYVPEVVYAVARPASQ